MTDLLDHEVLSRACATGFDQVLHVVTFASEWVAAPLRCLPRLSCAGVQVGGGTRTLTPRAPAEGQFAIAA
jgi:hypothetical protein